MPKNALGPMNSSKNKLNSEIILIFNPNPNAHFILKLSVYICYICLLLVLLRTMFVACDLLFFSF